MQIAMGVFPQFTALDAIGPYQVLTNLPGAELVICAARTGHLADDMSLLDFDIAHTFDDVAAPDVLLVPRRSPHPQARSRRRSCDRLDPRRAPAHDLHDVGMHRCAPARRRRSARRLRATSHWIDYDVLGAYGAEPIDERVVDEGKILAAAGVSADIDLALTLVGADRRPETAQGSQLGIEYDPQPPFDAGVLSKAPAEISQLAWALSTAAEDRLLRAS